MLSVKHLMRQGAATLVITATVFQTIPAHADGEFPFGLEMTLDVARQGGSKRLPTMEIGDNGEAVLELWCKAGKGQFRWRAIPSFLSRAGWRITPVHRRERRQTTIWSRR
jgi:hypothetical protein